jgi:hypothetical protein
MSSKILPRSAFVIVALFAGCSSSSGIPQGASGGATGGTSSRGGSVGSGGSTSASGGSGSGGAVGTGGSTTSSGGAKATGGAQGMGGNAATGGSQGTGGASPAGGATGIGGATGPGGTTGTCARPVGACTAPTTKVTTVSLGIAVTGYAQQADTDPFPMAISAIPSGGSRLAWLGTDKKVYVAQLDCDDQLVGTPFSFPAEDLQDLYADDSGGVVLLVRNATNSGTDNCGSGVLCGGTSSQCQNTWLVRFDTTGAVTWETQVTNLTTSLAGYDNGAIFTWKNYQHHGRIAFDGANYAAYFSAAITVYRTGSSGCIDIHEGDRMQVVDPNGKLLTGHNSFDWGCSHAWTTRILYDKTNKAFVMTCATDANNCAIQRPDTGALLFQATCSGQFFNGDLIPASDGAYWSAWSDTNAIRLNQFNFKNVKGTQVSSGGSSQHPHLVGYSASNMLLAWGSGTTMAAQVRSLTDASTVGAQFSIAVKDHAYQSFKPYPDGSAAYPAAGSTSTSINVARVMPCQ